jgi:hypothetical protein
MRRDVAKLLEDMRRSAEYILDDTAGATADTVGGRDSWESAWVGVWLGGNGNLRNPQVESWG